MELTIVSNGPEGSGRTLRGYDVDGITTVGAVPTEAYGIRFRNTSGSKIQIRIAVDGTDVLTGDKATLETSGRMFVVQPYAGFALDAWPESRQGGARFVFGDVTDSVAAHTHGDLTAKGYISVAVFVEGYQPPQFVREDGPLESYRGGGTRGATLGGSSYGATRGATKGGPATGAGAYTEQRIGTTTGLREPKYSELCQVRYMWWDDLTNRLRELRIKPAPVHPTGFEPTRLANLGSTPRLGVDQPAQTLGYSRFA